MSTYASLSHSKWDCKYHLVFVPKGRKRELHLRQSTIATLPYDQDSFDMIFSWSVFEHANWQVMEHVISELKRILRPSGIMFVQIDPLYYSARGAHLYMLLDQPWVHLLHQHDVLKDMLYSATKKLPATNQAQGETQLRRLQDYLWNQYRTLNRMTADQLIEVFVDQKFKLLREHRSRNSTAPAESLLRIYHEEVLMTNQIKAMFKLRG